MGRGWRGRDRRWSVDHHGESRHWRGRDRDRSRSRSRDRRWSVDHHGESRHWRGRDRSRSRSRDRRWSVDHRHLDNSSKYYGIDSSEELEEGEIQDEMLLSNASTESIETEVEIKEFPRSCLYQRNIQQCSFHESTIVEESVSPFGDTARSWSSPSNQDCAEKEFPRSCLYQRNVQQCSFHESTIVDFTAQPPSAVGLSLEENNDAVLAEMLLEVSTEDDCVYNITSSSSYTSMDLDSNEGNLKACCENGDCDYCRAYARVTGRGTDAAGSGVIELEDIALSTQEREEAVLAEMLLSNEPDRELAFSQNVSVEDEYSKGIEHDAPNENEDIVGSLSSNSSVNLAPIGDGLMDQGSIMLCMPCVTNMKDIREYSIPKKAKFTALSRPVQTTSGMRKVITEQTRRWKLSRIESKASPALEEDVELSSHQHEVKRSSNDYPKLGPIKFAVTTREQAMIRAKLNLTLNMRLFTSTSEALSKLLREELPSQTCHFHQVLTSHFSHCTSQGGKNVFESREITNKPGIYALLLALLEARSPTEDQSEQCTVAPRDEIKIGMSDEVSYGVKGRVSKQSGDVPPDACSRMLLTRDEGVELVNKSPPLRSFVDKLLPLCPRFQYNDDHHDSARYELINHLIEFFMMAILEKVVLSDESYEGMVVNAQGVALEKILNFGSKAIESNFCFPDSTEGDNAKIVDILRRSKSIVPLMTWVTAHTTICRENDSCTDILTRQGVESIIKRPKGDFVTKVVYNLLFDAPNNLRFSEGVNAVDSLPRLEKVDEVINDIRNHLNSPVLTTAEKKRQINDCLKKIDNSSELKDDFIPPSDEELARGAETELRNLIETAKSKIGGNGTAIIHVESFLIEKLGRKAMKKLFSKRRALEAVGPNGVAGVIRFAKGTDGKVCIMQTNSLAVAFGMGKEREVRDSTRVHRISEFITVLGLFREAGVVSSKHADKVKCQLQSVLMEWEHWGDISSVQNGNQQIRSSNLHKGIKRFLPRGFHSGKYLNRGVVALGNALAPSGINGYYVARSLQILGMKSFAKFVCLMCHNLVIDQENLGQTLDLLSGVGNITLCRHESGCTNVVWKNGYCRRHARDKGIKVSSAFFLAVRLLHNTVDIAENTQEIKGSKNLSAVMSLDVPML